jgi:hypothetical protein
MINRKVSSSVLSESENLNLKSEKEWVFLNIPKLHWNTVTMWLQKYFEIWNLLSQWKSHFV